MTPSATDSSPSRSTRHTYDQLYRRYCHMYQRLQPLYQEIRAITGYPSQD
jgi:ribulose kinase